MSRHEEKVNGSLHAHPRLVNLPVIADPRGNLTFIQNDSLGGFDIKAIGWYDRAGVERHSDYGAARMIITLNGSADIDVHSTDGSRQHFHLETPATGLFIPEQFTHGIENSSRDASFAVIKWTDRRTEKAPIVKTAAVEAHRSASVNDCRIIDMSETAIDNESPSIPFEIARIYYIYHIPEYAERGGHSHFEEQRIMTAAAGSFDVKVFDGMEWRTFHLSSPDKALFVPPGIWRVVDNFARGSICLAMCNNIFSESDYVRSFKQFEHLSAHKENNLTTL